MNNTILKMELITPERVVLAKEVLSVTVPGSEGDFGVLPGHSPFLSNIRAGEVIVEGADATTHLAVSGGIAEVLPERVTLLVDQALARENMDGNLIAQAIQDLSKRLASLPEGEAEYNLVARRLAFEEACQDILNRKNQA
ncbi:MAG: ATP synthase F1 subunit epsilon [Magnetococcales bacterium]|nr:ATP synthase F1 subunit epsilon [Magnetococcales bacterium]NGZ26906.1 ATP synthase F1 subunit epsilon [Magnetococcales bacterium]